MAEAVVTFFLQKLSTFISEQANLLLGVDEEVKLLQNKLEWISLFVRDADEKRRSDPKVKLWVKQLREITFHAEDVIDEFILKVDQRRHLGGFVGSLKSCITCPSQLPLLHDLRNQIKLINTRAEETSANQSKYGIQQDNQVVHGESSFHSRLVQRKAKRPPISEDYDVVGIEDSTEKVKSLLIGGGGDVTRRRAVVSVVGMGGLGKTTLANRVFQDVKKHFNCFAWVSVSQEFRLAELLQGIMKSVKTLSKEELEYLQKLNEEELKHTLREYLQQGDHKKYLIVLDDIWNVKDWDDLNTAFPDELNGSRILLTTRQKHVALHADPSPNNIHELRFLKEMESWELFLKKVFPLRGGEITGNSLTQTESWKLFLKKVFPLGGGGIIGNSQESKCPSELQALGMEMVKKCYGLPLAVVVLGGLLSSKEKTKTIWSKVNSSMKWQLTDGDGSYSCSEILALSYYDLPYYLKPCFMYVGIFPEDQEISASRLFQYWIAEGFVQSRGEESMEDVAEDYLEELIQRSMIQVGRWRYDGRVKSCRVHDLLRDLAIAEAREDQFFQVHERINESSAKSDKYVRRLSIHYLINPQDLRYFFDQFPYTRSLMCFEINLKDSKHLKISGCFKLLKVLELGKPIYIGRFQDFPKPSLRLPKAIGELIHLQYLGVSGVINIPNSIIKLVNLQTLYLRRCWVECTPSKFWMSLRQLRHFKHIGGYFRPTLSITNCDLEIDNLSNLQTLHVRSWYGINGGILGKLRMLKKLKIYNDIPRQSRKEILDSVAKLTSLRSLTLKTYEEFTEIQSFSRHNYLTKLILIGGLTSYTENLFPPNLVKLTLEQSKIETEGMVQDLAKLQNLKFLELMGAYKGKKLVFPQEGFLPLQFLTLKYLNEVEELIVEEGALISLTHLLIRECRRMKMLPDGLQQLTTLEELKVTLMPEEFTDRFSKKNGEDWEKIKYIPSVIIE